MKAVVQLLLVGSVAALPSNHKLMLGTRSSSMFKTLPKHPDFQEAKNVCLQIKEPCSSKLPEEGDDNSNKFLAEKLHLQPMPSDFKDTVHPSALLITRAKDLKFDRHHTFFQHHDAELSESILPMFDFVDELHQKTGKEVFSTVVMPQIPSAQHFMDHKSFDADVLDSLLETAGSKGSTKKLFCEDVKKESMVCFNRIVHYRHGHSKLRTEHAVTKVAASALRDHVSLKETVSSGRNAVLVLRQDHRGWVNHVEVEQKLRKVLSEKCWSLKTVEPSDSPVQHAIDSLKDADLVLANHGAHNEHMIWMPRGAAFIEDKNCKCSNYGYERLAAQEGIKYASTAGSNDSESDCAMQMRGEGICTKDKPRVVDFEKEILPTVESMVQLLEKSRSTPSECKLA